MSGNRIDLQSAVVPTTSNPNTTRPSNSNIIIASEVVEQQTKLGNMPPSGQMRPQPNQLGVQVPYFPALQSVKPNRR